MADFPTIDLTSQLIGAGLNPNDPTKTSMDFASQIAKNWRDQAEMEQNLAAAKETLAQSKIATRQKTAAEAAGYNPELIGTMSKTQALESVKVALKIKKIKVDEDVLDEWYKQLPALVKSSDVEAFVNSLTKTTGMNVWASTGTVKQYTEDDKMYNSFVRKDGKTAMVWDPQTGYPVYSNVEDNMAIHDVPLEEAQRMIRDAVKQEAGQERRFSLMEATRDIKNWITLGKEINVSNAPAARAIGQAAVNNMRADRALMLLEGKNELTKNEYDIIVSDLAAIFKGGVPDIISLEHQRYSSLKSDANDIIQYVTSKPSEVGTPEIRNRLLKITNEVKTVDNNIILNYIDSVGAGYEYLVQENPKRFTRMVNAQLRNMKLPEVDESVIEDMNEKPLGRKDAAKDTIGAEKNKPSSTDRLGLGPLPKGN